MPRGIEGHDSFAFKKTEKRLQRGKFSPLGPRLVTREGPREFADIRPDQVREIPVFKFRVEPRELSEIQSVGLHGVGAEISVEFTVIEKSPDTVVERLHARAFARSACR